MDNSGYNSIEVETPFITIGSGPIVQLYGDFLRSYISPYHTFVRLPNNQLGGIFSKICSQCFATEVFFVAKFLLMGGASVPTIPIECIVGMPKPCDSTKIIIAVLFIIRDQNMNLHEIHWQLNSDMGRTENMRMIFPGSTLHLPSSGK